MNVRRSHVALAALGLVALAAGCSLTDPCGPLAYDEADRTDRLAAALEADTVTVAFVRAGLDVIPTPPPEGRAPDATADSLRLRLGVGIAADRDADGIAAQTAVRGDTLFVRYGRPSALLRRACSPPVYYIAVEPLRVEAPAGVRHVRFVVVDERVAPPRATARVPEPVRLVRA